VYLGGQKHRCRKDRHLKPLAKRCVSRDRNGMGKKAKKAKKAKNGKGRGPLAAIGAAVLAAGAAAGVWISKRKK
jgi:hypothetical protein